MNLPGDVTDRNHSRRLASGGVLALLLGSVLVAAVVAAQAPWTGSRTLFGPAKPVGAGTARSYITMENGRPVELGFELTEDALHDLPVTAPAHPGHHMMVEYLLELPAEASAATPFRFLELDWNPRGHVPDGIYSSPHFDFHFFLISRAERDAITPADPAFTTRAAHLPRPELIPAGYFLPQPLDPVPFMGVHWVAADAHEFHGQPFTQTFIHGSWDGRMIFYEPMVSRAFLESKPDATFPVSPASCYEPAGYHPSTYSIRYDPEQRHYRVSLGGFSYRSCDALQTTLRSSSKP